MAELSAKVAVVATIHHMGFKLREAHDIVAEAWELANGDEPEAIRFAATEARERLVDRLAEAAGEAVKQAAARR